MLLQDRLDVPERIIFSTLVSSVCRIAQGLLVGLLFGTILLTAKAKGNLVELVLTAGPLSRELRIFTYLLAVLSWIGAADAFLDARLSIQTKQRDQSTTHVTASSTLTPRSFEEDIPGGSVYQSTISSSSSSSVRKEREDVGKEPTITTSNSSTYMSEQYCSTVTSFLLYTMCVLVVIVSLPVSKYLQLESMIQTAAELSPRQDILRDILAWEVMQTLAFVTNTLGWIIISCRLYSASQLDYLLGASSLGQGTVRLEKSLTATSSLNSNHEYP